MNKDEKELLEDLKKDLARQNLSIGSIAGLSDTLFYLKNICKAINNEEYNILLNKYMKLIETLNFQNVLENQIKYAIRLAEFDGAFIYEDMFKLFCLCDEILSLRSVGFKVEEPLNKHLIDALKYRFKKEPKLAKIVAEDLYEDWKSDYWWYSDVARHL